MTDAFLDPIVKTWDAHTTDEVRTALQRITRYVCEGCGGEYSSASASLACAEADFDMRPRD